MIAQIYYPNRKIVAVMGDSAFGFSGMDLETAARYKMPLIIFVINNNGIYTGLDKAKFSAIESSRLPASCLLPETRYEKIAEMVGGKGWLVQTPSELCDAAVKAFKEKEKVCVINVLIDPRGPNTIVRRVFESHK